MKKRQSGYVNVFAVALILVLGFAISGCSSKVSSEAAAMATTAAGAYDEGMNGAVPEVADAPMAEAGPGGLTADYKVEASAPTDRKLIRTVELEAETTDFDNLITQLTKKVAELGGYMEESRIDGNRLSNYSQPVAKMAVMTARVPGDKLEQLVSAVESNSNIVAKVEVTKDATLEYANIESLKKSLEIEQDPVWMIL